MSALRMHAMFIPLMLGLPRLSGGSQCGLTLVHLCHLHYGSVD